MKLDFFLRIALSSLLIVVVNSSSYFLDPACSRFPLDSNILVSRYDTIAGSPPLLRYLASKDEIIYAVVQDHYSRLGNRSVDPKTECYRTAVSSFLSHFESTTGKIRHRFVQSDESASFRPNNVAWNPLATFTLISRVTTILKPLLTTLNPYSEYEWTLQRKITQIMWDLGWPNDKDLRSAASSILRIQQVYDLSTSDLANGWIDGVETGIVLSPQDCNTIGRQGIVDGYYALAVEWFEQAVKQASNSTTKADHIQRSIAENNIKIGASVHDNLFDRSESWQPTFFRMKVKDQPSNKIRRRTYEFQTWKGGDGENFNEINYWGVCSGENYQAAEQRAKLFCYYERKLNPAWVINPLKVEILSFKPLLILQYYDLIGETMMRRLKNDVSGKLARSVVFDGPNQVMSEIRTSLNSWVDDNYGAEYGYIPRTIELITGLRVRSYTASELLQVAAYSTGSHYRVHTDAIGEDKLEEQSRRDKVDGDRVATFLFYLSDVEKGGGTAFPQSGIASSPVRGSAVLWYNLKRSGKLDTYTWHGSCPVILVANKWMHLHDQMFVPQFKCTGDPEEIVTMTVNGRPISEFY